jgi:hypothetical protein
MKHTLIVLGTALCASPALAECDPYTDLRSPDFAPVAAMVGDLTSMVVLDDGPPLSTGDRVIVTSGMDDEFSCVVRIGPDFQPQAGTVLSRFLRPDADAQGDWAGDWQAGSEQSIAITSADSGYEVSGEASYGMSDPQRVANGGVNFGDFGAAIKPKGSAVAFVAAYDGTTLPYDTDSDECAVKLWLLGEFLVALDNNGCGGANVSFTGFYGRN